ncbi:MAG: glucose 1-dehydrogenase [Candidatus Korobacteraceae bacterium]
MSLELDLTGKVALVTGGSRGIGAACVRLFAQAGANVLFNYQKSSEAAEKVVIASGSDRCAAVQSDLIGEGAEQMLVEEAVARFGYLDILVVNHAIWEPHDRYVDQMDDEQWRSTMAVNLDSAFLLVKYAVRAMRGSRRGGGHIVMVSSAAAQRGQAFHCDYAATKGAIISMVKSLAAELASERIYVNCVAPGWVATDMTAPLLSQPEMAERIASQIPLGRIARPEEIAAPIVFLCSPLAGFITGEVLNVNGGSVMAG